VKEEISRPPGGRDEKADRKSAVSTNGDAWICRLNGGRIPKKKEGKQEQKNKNGRGNRLGPEARLDRVVHKLNFSFNMAREKRGSSQPVPLFFVRVCPTARPFSMSHGREHASKLLLVETIRSQFAFEFTSTTRDLLDAYTAHVTMATGMRPFFRWVMALFGVLYVALFFDELFSPSAEGTWQPYVWLSLGSWLSWRNLVRPLLEQRKIRKQNPPTQQITVRFDPDGIQIDVHDVDFFHRKWNELQTVQTAHKGILLYFMDGAVNWLPHRIHSSETEKQQFTHFLKHQLGARP
jgi:hypothetical protein